LPIEGDVIGVSRAEVARAVSMSPTNCAVGPDQAPTQLLKIIFAHHADALCRIFTRILRTGIHPEEWKESLVIPIPKAYKPTMSSPKSWRQIHLLSVFSKTLERIVLGRLEEAVDAQLSPTQFGTRRRRGVADVAAVLKSLFAQARERKLSCSLIVSDVEGGFDKVPPEALANLAIFPAAYRKWVFSWCAGRRARYRFNGRTSDLFFIPTGIPQGSPLSPYLFGMYVASINGQDALGIDSPSHMRLVLSYVDDFVLFLAARTERNLEKLAKDSFGELKDRAGALGLSFAGR
jgi:hypothetical protein